MELSKKDLVDILQGIIGRIVPGEAEGFERILRAVVSEAPLNFNDYLLLCGLFFELGGM